MKMTERKATVPTNVDRTIREKRRSMSPQSRLRAPHSGFRAAGCGRTKNPRYLTASSVIPWSRPTRLASRCGERVPAPGEQRQRVAGDGAEVLGQRRRGDGARSDGPQADQVLEPDRGGDFGVVNGLESARGPLERILLRQSEAGLGELLRHRPIGLGRARRGGSQAAKLSRIGHMKAGGEE